MTAEQIPKFNKISFLTLLARVCSLSGYFGGTVGTADNSDARGLQFNYSYFSKIGHPQQYLLTMIVLLTLK